MKVDGIFHKQYYRFKLSTLIKAGELNHQGHLSDPIQKHAHQFVGH